MSHAEQGEDEPEPETVVVNDRFLDRLDALVRAEKRVQDLGDRLERIDTGLDGEDTERLLWAHLHDWSLTDVRQALDGLDAAAEKDEREIVRRLVAQYGGTTLDEADEFLEQVERLRDHYGDRADDDEVDA